MSNILTCVYCGHAYPEGTPPHGSQILTDHIRVCEKHPLRDAERQLAEAREAVKAAADDLDQTIRFVGAFVHRIRGGGRIHLEQWLKDAENRLHNAKLARKKLNQPGPADTDGAAGEDPSQEGGGS